MDPRDLLRTNTGNLGPASFSVSLWNLVPGTNWGVPVGPLFVVKLDPQVNAGTGQPEFSRSDPGIVLRSEFLKRRARRKLMADLTREFVVGNDELLRELAR